MSELKLEGAPASVDKREGCSHTEYAIRGELHAVFRAIEALFVNYHPCGYGTHVHSIGTTNGIEYQARVSRLNSCD